MQGWRLTLVCALKRARIKGDRPTDWNAVERGLQQAIAQQLISANSPVALRLTHFLTYVRNGMPMQQAIQKAQVTMAVVAKLAEMGTAKPRPTANSVVSDSP